VIPMNRRGDPATARTAWTKHDTPSARCFCVSIRNPAAAGYLDARAN
jgi:hypothetical protein